MRKLILLFISLLMCYAIEAQSVEEVLHKFEIAMGTKAAFDTITSLQINGSLKFDIMGRNIDGALTTVKKQGKFYRSQLNGVMGMSKSYTIVTNTEGFTYLPQMRGGGYGGRGGGRGEMGGAPPPPPSGGDGDNSSSGLYKLDSVQVASQQFELDCAGFFAPLINYAAKGNKVEWLGSGKVNKVECYKLKLTLKTGQETVYYFSTKDSLIVQSETIAKVVMDQVGMAPVLKTLGASNRGNLKTVMTYNEYKLFNGIKFPTKQRLTFGALDISVETDDVKINQPIDAKWYTAD